jgi:chromosome condensin MukBEF ATPase and DNA-binding subunit MukB
MWGALTNKAQQLAAIAAEQAQKGLTQANQLLEKLDGLDDEELENDENDEGVENNDKAEDSEDVVKNLDQDADSNEISPLTPFAPRRNETIRDKEVNNEEDDDKEDDFFTPMKEPVKKKPHFDMSYTIDEGESTVDDELDQLVLEDDLEVQPIVEVATAQSNLEENKEPMAAGDLGHLQYEV